MDDFPQVTRFVAPFSASFRDSIWSPDSSFRFEDNRLDQCQIADGAREANDPRQLRNIAAGLRLLSHKEEHNGEKDERGRAQDRRLVAAGQDYEVRYEAKKTGKSKKQVKQAVKSAGPSRKNVEWRLGRVTAFGGQANDGTNTRALYQLKWGHLVALSKSAWACGGAA